MKIAEWFRHRFTYRLIGAIDTGESKHITLYMTDSGKRKAIIPKRARDLEYLSYMAPRIAAVRLWEEGGPFPKQAVYFKDTLKDIVVRLVQHSIENGDDNGDMVEL